MLHLLITYASLAINYRKAKDNSFLQTTRDPVPYHLNGRLQERLDLILGRRQDLLAAGPLQGRLEPLDGLVVVTLVEGVLAQEQAVAGI